MQRVVVSVRRSELPAKPGHPPGWVVSFARRTAGEADRPVGRPVEMPATLLLLQLGGGQQRRVKVPHAGELGEEELTALLTRRAKGQVTDGDGPKYGRWLQRAMFETKWAELEELADSSGLELALAWDVDDHDLNSLVWESMYAPPLPGAGHAAQDEPLAALKRPRPLVAFTRLVSPLAPRTAEQLGLPIRSIPRVLFAMGAQPDDPQVRPGAMFLGLLRSFEAEGTCVARVIPNVSLAELQTYCNRYHPEIVHLVAHGVVDDRTGEVSLVLKGERVGHAQIKGALGEPVAVFLSACETGRAGADQAPLAAQLVRDGVPIVIGMAGKIGVGACRLFTRKLIEAVASGQALVEGSADGRRAALWLAADPDSDLDWALPTAFMSDVLVPDCRILDRTATILANRVVADLQIGRNPAFCGRKEVLDVTDGLLPRPGEQLDERAARGLVVAHATGPSFDLLGSRRLLREIACRFVRAGHVPLLLGPFTNGMAPTSFAGLIGALLEKIIDARSIIGLPLSWPGLLGRAPAAPSFADLKAAIDAFKTSIPNPNDVKNWLAPEFAGLAKGYAAAGGPFGSHTHVAVLGDAAHDWNDALEPLLGIVKSAGLGPPGGPLVPLIFTTLFDAGKGIYLSNQRAALGNAGKLVELGQFGDAEAIAAYNWTLLQPWQGAAYIAKEGKDKRWDGILRRRFADGHFPAYLETELYNLVLAYMADDEEDRPLRRIDEDDDAVIEAMRGDQ